MGLPIKPLQEAATEHQSFCPSIIETRLINKDTGIGKFRMSNQEDAISQATTTKYKATDYSNHEAHASDIKTPNLVLNQSKEYTQNNEDEIESQPSQVHIHETYQVILP